MTALPKKRRFLRNASLGSHSQIILGWLCFSRKVGSRNELISVLLNCSCPALSDTDSWEFWDDPAENDPRQRFELPQWKYIHQHVPNPQFTAKTLQDIAFSPDCYKTVHDAIIFKLFRFEFFFQNLSLYFLSERFFENERLWLDKATKYNIYIFCDKNNQFVVHFNFT